MRLLQKKLSQFNRLQEIVQNGLYPYYRVLESGQDAEVIIGGEKKLMFGSNSYLGLTNHPKLIEAAQAALAKYGTGASGSRLLNGNLDLHEKLDNMLAEFVNKEAAVVFGTGFQVNIGVIPSILSRNDFLIMDEDNHASIFEGSRLTFAKVLKYKHNDMESLESVLKKTIPNQIKLIVIDGIFSMEGDICKLDKIVELANKYDASVMVDDAHGIGVLGEGGRGTSNHFGLEDNIDLIMGTFSKSFASLGGFIASDRTTIEFIKHQARSLLFSAGTTPASAATVIAALEVMKEEPERLEQLWENTIYARNLLTQEGFEIGNTSTPIIPIKVGTDTKAYQYFALMLEKGVYVNCVVTPAVKPNEAILRYSLMATHTKEMIHQSVDKLIRCRELLKRL
jgi:8-amino-7-oxononanoate synthase